ncbi:MAG: hypothetical protein D3X82_16755 [Candidatus Leucobacter sulfamidivorax]|nr:hypothetical protein [Candidatus Leucobacter sulfamidivorax]
MSRSTLLQAVDAELTVVVYAEFSIASVANALDYGVENPVSGDAIAVLQRGTEADQLGRGALTNVVLRKALGRE